MRTPSGTSVATRVCDSSLRLDLIHWLLKRQSTGPFPYWEWGYDAYDVESSPLFDGSPTSLGSNGAYIEGQEGFFGMPPGSGGGCLVEGPFSNRTVNLGPGAGPDAYDYNPRCIRRDLNTPIAAEWTTFSNTTDVILKGQDVEMFQALMQGDARYPEAAALGLAIHGGGHFAIGEFRVPRGPGMFERFEGCHC